MIAEYLHHVTVHFPIVMSILLGLVALWSLRDRAPQLQVLLRFAGWATTALTTAAVISGIVAAPGLLGGDGPDGLDHHRYLGLTCWIVMVIATLAFEFGVRHDHSYARDFGALCWTAAAFAAVGAGHWGGSALHSDVVPWSDEAPIIRRDAEPVPNS